MLESLMTHSLTAVAVAAWCVYRLKPKNQTLKESGRLLVGLGPKPTTPK